MYNKNKKTEKGANYAPEMIRIENKELELKEKNYDIRKEIYYKIKEKKRRRLRYL